MIVAIMQPYFFPYIGYFQLMRAAEVFVFLDDVQYIDRGWVNRNQILLADKLTWLTMPVKKASRTLSINQREFLLDQGVAPIRRRLQAAYQGIASSPGGRLINEVLEFPQSNVAKFNANLLRMIAGELDVRCEFLDASHLHIDQQLRGQERIISICRHLGATHYVNLFGGAALYDEGGFLDAGIRLSFLRTISSPTASAHGLVHLSIIDRLVCEGISATRSKLTEFAIHAPGLIPE